MAHKSKLPEIIYGNITFNNNLIISGDLTVNGTTTTINTANLDVVDKNITVNKNGTDASSDGAGINVEGTGASVIAALTYNQPSNRLEMKLATVVKAAADTNGLRSNQLQSLTGDLNLYTSGTTAGIEFTNAGSGSVNLFTNDAGIQLTSSGIVIEPSDLDITLRTAGVTSGNILLEANLGTKVEPRTNVVQLAVRAFGSQTVNLQEWRNNAGSMLAAITAAGLGNFANAIRLGNTTDTTDGNIRWTGTDFEGRKAGAWVSMTGSGSGFVTGTGTAGRVAIWTGTSSIADDAELLYNSTTNRLTTGQLESTVTTGTAPLVVASTTVVANLNADSVDGQHTSNFGVGGLRVGYVSTAADYTLLTTDYIVGVTDLTVTRTMNLPAAATAGAGRIYEIKDETGNASPTTRINIDPNGSETIDGNPTAEIITAYGSMKIYCTGTAWFII